MKHKIYCIGIGWIGISALARYFHANNYKVYGSDASYSKLIQELQNEWIDISLKPRPEILDDSFEYVIYSEAIPEDHEERIQAIKQGIPTYSYPHMLGIITKTSKLIAVAGTHGKSTTASLIALLLHKTYTTNAIIGSLIPFFWWKNCYFTSSPYFVIEACEYKRSFLHYTPFIGVITNIDIDHLDYYKDRNDYTQAFYAFIDRIVPWWYLLYNGEEREHREIYTHRSDIETIPIYHSHYIFQKNTYYFPHLTLQTPGDHILFDAKIAYALGEIISIPSEERKTIIESYPGIWRRSERIGITLHGNILMSDYGHHPTEIALTLQAIAQAFREKKLCVFFQPHQYSRTHQFLENFTTCFHAATMLCISDIYESRDSEQDKQTITSLQFFEAIHHPNKYYTGNLTQTLQKLREIDTNFPHACILLLLWAGNIDSLRYSIPLQT